MVWPFTRKSKKNPAPPVNEQVQMSIKSLSLPESTPHWWLFAKRDDMWRAQTAIDEGYNASAIVYSAVEKRAKLIASAPWLAKRLRGEDWE